MEVGNQLLEGKVEALKKPLLVCRRMAIDQVRVFSINNSLSELCFLMGCLHIRRPMKRMHHTKSLA
jgi:hypothetical protein